MEQGLLFAIRARGSEERWRAQGTTLLRCRTRFVSCCRTTARRRGSRPRPTLARNRLNAPRDHTPSSLSATMLQRTMCLRSSCPSVAASGTASEQSHGMRMVTASLPTRTAKMGLSRLLFGTGRIFQTCHWKFQRLGLWATRSKKPGARCVVNTSRLFTPSRMIAHCLSSPVVECSDLYHI